MGWDFSWFNKSCIQLSRRSVDPIIYRNLPVWCLYRSINMSCWILAYNNTETLSPGNLKKDSKESCLFQETSFDKRNRLKCCRDFFLLRISDHKFSTGRHASFSCVVGWGWKTHQKNNRTIVPEESIAVFHRYHDYHLWGNSTRVLFFVVSMEIFAAFAQNLRFWV